jgi:pimeloyl-ACP methyl ester carboxylesterase
VGFIINIVESDFWYTHVADNVQGIIIPDSGHWVAEETPEKLLAALTPFLAPYRAVADFATWARARI